jgi:hypothetical protein
MAEEEAKDLMMEKYAARRENFKITFALAGEHAKWLLSTLLLINSGAIAVIFQKDMQSGHRASLGLFGLGVFFALLSGILGWFNLQCAAKHYYKAADDLLAGRSDPPMPRSIYLLRYWAIRAAMSSVGCIVLGAAAFVFVSC